MSQKQNVVWDQELVMDAEGNPGLRPRRRSIEQDAPKVTRIPGSGERPTAEINAEISSLREHLSTLEQDYDSTLAKIGLEMSKGNTAAVTELRSLAAGLVVEIEATRRSLAGLEMDMREAAKREALDAHRALCQEQIVLEQERAAARSALYAAYEAFTAINGRLMGVNQMRENRQISFQAEMGAEPFELRMIEEQEGIPAAQLVRVRTETSRFMPPQALRVPEWAILPHDLEQAGEDDSDLDDESELGDD